MKFDVYRRFQIEVLREGSSWAAYRVELGKRRRLTDVIIPPTLEQPEEIATFLDDLFHELSGPGENVEIVRET